MRSWLAIAWCVAACAACAAPDDRLQRNGGGPGGGGKGSGAPDAAPGAIDAALVTLHGVVCTATDLRAPTACVESPGAGLPVSDLASGATATTAADSSFALDVGAETLAQIDVETGGDAQLVPSVASVAPGAASIIVPVVDNAYLEDLEAELSAVVPDGAGIVALYIDDSGGAGVAGFSVTPPPGIPGVPYYDDATAIGWEAGGTTGAIGGALLFGVPEGTVSIGIANGTTSATLDGVRVRAGHVTFARAIVAP